MISLVVAIGVCSIFNLSTLLRVSIFTMRCQGRGRGGEEPCVLAQSIWDRRSLVLRGCPAPAPRERASPGHQAGTEAWPSQREAPAGRRLAEATWLTLKSASGLRRRDFPEGLGLSPHSSCGPRAPLPGAGEGGKSVVVWPCASHSLFPELPFPHPSRK